jgi:hypothetical protein
VKRSRGCCPSNRSNPQPGISAPHRLKDLADVLELIRQLSLPRQMAESLDPSVQAKYEELWQAAQTAERE